MKRKAFSKEQDDWLIEHHSPVKFIKSLTEEYNKAFNENRTVDTIKGHCRVALGLKQKPKKYTDEMDDWLRKHSGKLSAKEMAEQFNATFSENRSEGTIKVHCNRDLRIGFSNIKFNSAMPIGTEVVRGKYVWVKVSDKSPKFGEQSGWINWKPKAHVVWKQYYGSMPENGRIIVFLDGNRQNTDISNLYSVDGKVLREMSKKKWWSSEKNLTLTAIKWCEMFYAIKSAT